MQIANGEGGEIGCDQLREQFDAVLREIINVMRSFGDLLERADCASKIEFHKAVLHGGTLLRKLAKVDDFGAYELTN